MLKVGTVFSGIGAFEQALKRMNINHQILFACDNDKFVKQSGTYFIKLRKSEQSLIIHMDQVLLKLIPFNLILQSKKLKL